jgi:hypothetical protein
MHPRQLVVGLFTLLFIVMQRGLSTLNTRDQAGAALPYVRRAA